MFIMIMRREIAPMKTRVYTIIHLIRIHAMQPPKMAPNMKRVPLEFLRFFRVVELESGSVGKKLEPVRRKFGDKTVAAASTN